MVIDVDYRFGPGSVHGNGIGYHLIHRARGTDQEIAALNNIGRGFTNGLAAIWGKSKVRNPRAGPAVSPIRRG